MANRLLEMARAGCLREQSARLLEGSGVVELYLPYEFTSVLIVTSNTDPFGIDPEQTTLIP